MVNFADNIESTCPGRTTSGNFRQLKGSNYQNKTTPDSRSLSSGKKFFLKPKLQRLLATKNEELGGRPMQSSTFTTNGFNNRKWESTAFEATNS